MSFEAYSDRRIKRNAVPKFREDAAVCYTPALAGRGGVSMVLTAAGIAANTVHLTIK
jgi:hypothetical protein